MVQYVLSWTVFYFHNRSFEVIPSGPAGLSECAALINAFLKQMKRTTRYKLGCTMFSFREAVPVYINHEFVRGSSLCPVHVCWEHAFLIIGQLWPLAQGYTYQKMSMEVEIAKVSCNVTIGETSKRIKTTASAEFTVSQHNFDCACVPAGNRIKHPFDFWQWSQRTTKKGNKVLFFFKHTRKWCGFGAAAYWLLVSWFTVESKCIMRAL